MATSFPNAVQSFKQWEDLTSAQLTAYVNYINALNRGDWASARRIFENGNLSENMLPTAKDFNEMCDTILECKALYEAPDTSAKGIQDFMAQFAYKGVWSASSIAQYKKFSIVRYADPSYGTFLYIANQNITTTQPPWDNSLTINSQWLRVAPITITNANSVFRGVWVNNVTYDIGDIVTSDNKFYKAVATSAGQTPPNTAYWTMLFDMNPYIAQLSPTQPTRMVQGSIWFKQLQGGDIMAILTPDYERLQNGQTTDFDITQEYREDFKNQNITAAQALITSANDYLVMKASKLNDLCDTILYTEQFWEDDKDTFTQKYFRLTETPNAYSASETYNIGNLVIYNGDPYVCTSDNTIGTWDDSKWIKIGNDDVGLVFVGQREPLITYPNGALLVNGETGSIPPRLKLPVTWEYKMNDSFTQCGATYPNIRYLTSNDTPYANEIYMTDWDGGGV